jgi:hypothetical protein
MHEWLDDAQGRIAKLVGDDASDYALSDADADRLLALAGVAAHTSGERTNAPLVTFLTGFALGRHAERTLDEVARAAAGRNDE